MGLETILTSVFLSFSTNLDNLAVGMTYGMRQLTIGWWGNLLIASLSGVSTFFSMSVGDWLEDFLNPNLAQDMGAGIIVLMGLGVLWNAYQEETNETQDFSRPSPKNKLSFTRIVVLGLALTVTNWGTGIGAGIAELNSGLTSSFSFLSSLVTIGGGMLLGKWATRQLTGNWLSWVSGLGLILLGIYEGV
ncbi:manganese efflux pump [Spirulina sp. CS-785/01]|uniref:manganese efflux pump n=1 Tax=Spirulina sp. CS-785/01 TaxID=3021716 RepID=UPI00232DE7BC|nr:manganese efflux pump [Spirulina sp. CS-785/01]MDB9315534.1 manganese efflux pump [Spirulina sp. CS-785/01]